MRTVNLLGEDHPDAQRAVLAVARFFGFTVRILPPGSPPGDGPLILGSAPALAALAAGSPAQPVLRFGAAAGGAAASTRLVFGDHPRLPSCLQNRTLLVQEPIGRALSAAAAEGEVAATTGDGPAWILGRSGPLRLSVATPAPRLGPEQRLAEIFNGETFLHVLPAWLFFRALAGPPPESPLRACLIVDDPNLHSGSYGHLNYAEVVELARHHPFHLAVATVPLDSWMSSRPTVRRFAENPRALSLLVHGNDHLHYELSQCREETARAALAAQALARVAAFERNSGLKVDRVMAPPHGVCSPEMMATLRRAGFDGLTTNRWSLWKHSPPAALPVDFGLRPADILADGLPVVPRFRFNSKIAANEVALAALLGQPIVPYGHHGDFADRLAVVRGIVDTINSLGEVHWMGMREILEGNFTALRRGPAWVVTLASRRVRSRLPAGCGQVEICAPGFRGALELGWARAGGIPEWQSVAPGTPVDLDPGSSFEVRVLDSDLGAPGEPEYHFRTGAFLKRVVSEARDRLLA